eukprot:Skav218618  [mRNA]  locus=scaffold3208:132869:133780:- [translate_table: standard]
MVHSHSLITAMRVVDNDEALGTETSDNHMLPFCVGRRIVDEEQAPLWLCQAQADLKAMVKMASDSEGGPCFAHAVWLAQQVVEKALKSAMLRTCGLTKDEFIGKDCHDIATFHQRLKHADAATQPQRRDQEELPGDASVMQWLKNAYIATRYPNATHISGSAPAETYTRDDAEKAKTIAEEMVRWAKCLEDLPEPKTDLRNLRRKTIAFEDDAPTMAAPAQGPMEHHETVKAIMETCDRGKLPVGNSAEAMNLTGKAPPPLATTSTTKFLADGEEDCVQRIEGSTTPGLEVKRKYWRWGRKKS